MDDMHHSCFKEVSYTLPRKAGKDEGVNIEPFIAGEK